MASGAIRKVQEKLFRSGNSPPVIDDSGTSTPRPPFVERVEPPTPLTIEIPKQTPSTPIPPPRKQADAEPKNGDDADTPRPYRERLAQKLGRDYKGAESYRLDQDNEREKHWKRWGPYLADRQWVGVSNQWRLLACTPL